ncbi:CvpA family protein [Flavobacterium sp. NRK F10]|uniref:CvpA family protein n=1 Tax=Flavobacterium sp. NRK F10 TaxID=2954931 RepID=UPI00209173D5|nr:CvpA family protein [Flavobacterium sp. NRK F10]MCO6174665.1 CvpA family protein [Flavobacterium sp. NRK F10]
MSFIDIVFAVFLSYALYKGIKNGLFVELASLIALVAGIFVAIKFSYVLKSVLETKVSWEPKYIEIAAFALTFIFVVVVIHLSAKLLTKIADFAYLGWMNKLAGAFFSALKTILMLSVVILLFEKMNVNNMLVEQETLDESIFYNPTKEISAFLYPKIEEWYENSVQPSTDNENAIDLENEDVGPDNEQKTE